MLDVHKQVKSLGVYIQKNSDIFKAAVNRAQRTNSIRTIIANISNPEAVHKVVKTPAVQAAPGATNKRRVTITADDKNNEPGTHSLTYSLTHLTTYSLTHSLSSKKE